MRSIAAETCFPRRHSGMQKIMRRSTIREESKMPRWHQVACQGILVTDIYGSDVYSLQAISSMKGYWQAVIRSSKLKVRSSEELQRFYSSSFSLNPQRIQSLTTLSPSKTDRCLLNSTRRLVGKGRLPGDINAACPRSHLILSQISMVAPALLLS